MIGGSLTPKTVGFKFLLLFRDRLGLDYSYIPFRELWMFMEKYNLYYHAMQSTNIGFQKSPKCYWPKVNTKNISYLEVSVF